MKKTMRSVLLTAFLGIMLFANNAKAQDTLKIKETARLMINAFLKEDFKTLLVYTYPKVIRMAGGKEKMKALIDLGMKGMRDKGISFRNVSLGPISKIYKAGTELHCKITQYTALNVNGGYLTSTSPLMCISSDGGKNWTFISAGEMNEAKIKMLFPDFNHELVLEQGSIPVFHKE